MVLSGLLLYKPYKYVTFYEVDHCSAACQYFVSEMRPLTEAPSVLMNCYTVTLYLYKFLVEPS